MSVPVWLIVTLCTVAVDVRLGYLLVRLNVKIPRCWIIPSVVLFKYPLLFPPPESRAQKTSPVVELQVNITVSPGHTGVYEGEL